jgi:hypothetical protein
LLAAKVYAELEREENRFVETLEKGEALLTSCSPAACAMPVIARRADWALNAEKLVIATADVARHRPFCQVLRRSCCTDTCWLPA